MGRRKLVDSLTNYFETRISDLGYELVDLEYVRENSRNFLRFYIDKVNGINIEDCQRASEMISQDLDELDPISESYYLEVSSPGLDRPLKNDKDLKRNIGKKLEISLYKKLNDKKQIIGKLINFNGDSIIVEEDNSDEISIDRSLISLIKLWVEF